MVDEAIFIATMNMSIWSMGLQVPHCYWLELNDAIMSISEVKAWNVERMVTCIRLSERTCLTVGMVLGCSTSQQDMLP